MTDEKTDESKDKPSEDAEEPSTDKPDDLKKEVDTISLEAINKRKDELVEIEKRVDVKLKQLRDIVDETKREGKGMMIPKPAEKPEETDKEYSDRIDQEVRDGKYNG